MLTRIVTPIYSSSCVSILQSLRSVQSVSVRRKAVFVKPNRRESQRIVVGKTAVFVVLRRTTAIVHRIGMRLEATGNSKNRTVQGSRKSRRGTFGIPKTWKWASYFPKPRRRRSSLAEMAPSFFTRFLDRSMILRNLRLVLSARISSSVFRSGITAANGFPAL